MKSLYLLLVLLVCLSLQADAQFGEGGDDEDVEWDEENVYIKIITLNINACLPKSKIVVKPEEEDPEPEQPNEPEKPETPKCNETSETQPKRKKKVKVQLNVANPDHVQALVDKDKGEQLVSKLMDSIPKSAHQEEIANIFADTVKQAVENLDEERAKQGPNFFSKIIRLVMIIDDPKHVEALIQESGEEEMADKLRNELPDNEMVLLDSVWGAVKQSAEKDR